MRDTLDRLNYQMNELKTAQNIDELKTRRQLQREKEAKERADREEAYRREKTERDEAFRREQFEWQKEKAEKAEAAQAAALERQERRDAATIAQGWSRINAERDKTKTSMLAAGWVPDKSAPGGFRYDPEKAKEYGVVVGGSKDKKEGLSLPIIDADGNVNLANVGDKEQLKIIMNTAINAIKRDLGEEQAKELESRLTMADSDESREAILTEWIGKSPTMEAELKKYDPNYKGNHGGSKGFTGGTMSGDDFIKALNG
jgi:apoptotic chromatin condensation inducer in the nucleus